MNRKQQIDNALSDVRRILLNVWDPIGVNHVSEANDEYDGYAPAMVGMLLRGATEADLVHHLRKIETENMGLSYLDEQRLINTAQALLAVDR